MRLGGITLTVLGLVALAWFGWLTSPEPEAVCGTDSNFVVAWNGYDSFPVTPAQSECQRNAAVNLAKGAAVGAPLILAGVVLIIIGSLRSPANAGHEDETPTELSPGHRSEDGTSWWDGYRWHPIATESAGVPPAP